MTKPTKWVCTQQRLGSAQSLCAQQVAKNLSFLHANSEVSDQTGRMPRLIRVFAGRTVTCHVAAHISTLTFLSVKHHFVKRNTVEGIYKITTHIYSLSSSFLNSLFAKYLSLVKSSLHLNTICILSEKPCIPFFQSDNSLN